MIYRKLNTFITLCTVETLNWNIIFCFIMFFALIISCCPCLHWNESKILVDFTKSNFIYEKFLVRFLLVFLWSIFVSNFIALCIPIKVILHTRDVFELFFRSQDWGFEICPQNILYHQNPDWYLKCSVETYLYILKLLQD